MQFKLKRQTSDRKKIKSGGINNVRAKQAKKMNCSRADAELSH